jgi:hypothetical protein
MSAQSVANMEDLLKPQQFDWAEDVEENIIQVEGPLDNLSLKPQEFDWAEDVENSLSSGNATDTASDAVYEVNGLSVYGETCLNEAGNTPEPPTEPLYTLDEKDAVQGDDLNGEEDEHQNEILQSWIADEFCYRGRVMYDDKNESVHHFNWYGNPVGQYSDTHPAHSLMFILSGPKAPEARDENRIRSILSRACHLVDPVIYTGRLDVLGKTGQDLVNAVIGNVYKFYTPHGSWMADGEDLEQQTVEDVGTIDIYKSHEGAVANGFYDHPLVPTRFEKTLIGESPCTPTPWEFQGERPHPYSPSSLQFSTSPETETCSMNPVRVRRVQGKYQWWEEAKAADAVSSGASSMMQDSVEENSASPENSSGDEGCWPSTEASSLKDDSELEELEGCEPDVDLASAFKPQDDVIRFAEPLTHTVPDRADTGDMVVDDVDRNASAPDQSVHLTAREEHRASPRRPNTSEDIQLVSCPEPLFAKDSEQTKPSRTTRFKNFWKKISGKLRKRHLGEQRTPVSSYDSEWRGEIVPSLPFCMDWVFLI